MKIDPEKYPAIAVTSHPSRTTQRALDELQRHYRARYSNGILSEHVAQELEVFVDEKEVEAEVRVLTNIIDMADEGQASVVNVEFLRQCVKRRSGT